MNKETIEIPLRKATYEELQEVICELQVERCVKDKEIDRLNNIISELEKWLEEQKDFLKEISFIQTLKEIKMEHKIMISDYQNVLDKLKELKEKE